MLSQEFRPNLSTVLEQQPGSGEQSVRLWIPGTAGIEQLLADQAEEEPALLRPPLLQLRLDEGDGVSAGHSVPHLLQSN